jgi:hypothetical protein
VAVAIDEQIEKLTERLVHAKAREAARIHTRIKELEALKKEHTTT